MQRISRRGQLLPAVLHGAGAHEAGIRALLHERDGQLHLALRRGAEQERAALLRNGGGASAVSADLVNCTSRKARRLGWGDAGVRRSRFWEFDQAGRPRSAAHVVSCINVDPTVPQHSAHKAGPLAISAAVAREPEDLVRDSAVVESLVDSLAQQVLHAAPRQVADSLVERSLISDPRCRC